LPGTDVVAERFAQLVRVLCARAEFIQRGAEIVLGLSPVERDVGLRIFQQGGAKGGNGVGEVLGAGLALAEVIERGAEIVLGLSPVERDAGLRIFQQGGAKGGDGVGEVLGAGLPPAEVIAPLRWSRKASYRNRKKRRLMPRQTKSLARRQSRGREQQRTWASYR